jgi:magnesium transporter
MSNPAPESAPVNGGIAEPFQKRWFCVGLNPSGKTFKQDAESPAAFLDLLAGSVITWVDFITDDPLKDLPPAAAQLGFSQALIDSTAGESPLNYQDFDTEMFLQLPCIQIRQVKITAYPLLLLVREKVVLSIHTGLVDKRFIRLRRYSDTILRKIALDISPEDKLTVLLSRIIDTNNDSNFRHLRIIEELGDDLNQDLMSPSTDRTQLAPKIYEIKHTLITYMNALWESVDLLHTLRYGDAALLSNDDRLLNVISGMIEQVKGQIGLAEHMSEVVASGLEVMQSIYNNQLQVLNNRLAMVITYLTILGTAVLVPNTLATILGNSAFNMGPGDRLWYIVLLVVSTVAATYGMWIWMKKSGWLPKRPEG